MTYQYFIFVYFFAGGQIEKTITRVIFFSPLYYKICKEEEVLTTSRYIY